MHHTDMYVGRKIRERRVLLAMTQEELARQCGISFQQVQKYEKGSNRVVSSRLFQFACVLHVPVSYFFEGLSCAVPFFEHPKLEESEPVNFNPRALDSEDSSGHLALMNKETLAMVKIFHQIQDPSVRRKVYGLLKILTS